MPLVLVFSRFAGSEVNGFTIWQNVITAVFIKEGLSCVL